MNEIQKVILDIFKEFDKICSENNIPYYAIGGTCIGAIRHKGFIPWDDDMDVAIPIEFFDEFVRIASKELPSYYKLFTSLEVKHYRNLFIKIIDSRTTFIETLEYEYEDTYKGIFLDIMPISGIPNGIFSKYLFKFKQTYYYFMNNTIRYPKEYILASLIGEKTKSKKIIWKIAYAFSGLLKRREFNYYTKKWLKLLKENPFYNSKFTGYVWHNKLGKLIFPTNDFGKGTRLPFEDVSIICPENYDSYLSSQFGDYMKMPPVDKQITCHPGVVDHLRPFSEYVGKLNGGQEK